ncbi:MAG TPA: helix-turn-helix domain-containing protein [Thermoplasmata archaeon]|nr:helix-turn-helix domain-containing protein [Thermoplasmata archaeon]
MPNRILTPDEIDPQNPPFKPTKEMVACPIVASLGVLGRKWALIVLRDITFCHETTFSVVLRLNPGLSRRVLAKRLVELRAAGLIERGVAERDDKRYVTYRLTRKGKDVVPVLTSLVSFGIQHHSATVFSDRKPRSLGELYPRRQAELLGRLNEYALGAKGIPSR